MLWTLYVYQLCTRPLRFSRCTVSSIARRCARLIALILRFVSHHHFLEEECISELLPKRMKSSSRVHAEVETSERDEPALVPTMTTERASADAAASFRRLRNGRARRFARCRGRALEDIILRAGVEAHLLVVAWARLLRVCLVDARQVDRVGLRPLVEDSDALRALDTFLRLAFTPLSRLSLADLRRVRAGTSDLALEAVHVLLGY